MLSRWGPNSHNFWLNNVRVMHKARCYDDQFSLLRILRHRKGYSFKLLSSNWFFASHGITQTGTFEGGGKCYRSSIVVNGPVHWIHGHPNECEVMNGANNEFAFMDRVYFRCGRCKCNKGGVSVITSAKELQRVAWPSKAPSLNWNNNRHSRTSLFW